MRGFGAGVSVDCSTAAAEPELDGSASATDVLATATQPVAGVAETGSTESIVAITICPPAHAGDFQAVMSSASVIGRRRVMVAWRAATEAK